jgi:DNA polymerase III subunit epsilon
MKKFENIVFIDFETTGLNPAENHPTEIALKSISVPFPATPLTTSYNELIKLPEGVEISEFIQNLTGLTTEKVNSEGIDINTVKKDIQNLFTEETLVIAQSANFDLGYLKEHFDIVPEHFMCTKTIEFFTNPHLSTALNDTHKRYSSKSFEQTHRAMDDVNMLIDIYNGQVVHHGGAENMMFFMNKIAVMPERPLVFTPHNAIVLDYTQKYYSSKTVEKLEEKIEDLKEDAEMYRCLRNAGVDNWSGYDYAMELAGGNE